MNIHILDHKLNIIEVKEFANNWYGTMIKKKRVRLFINL